MERPEKDATPALPPPVPISIAVVPVVVPVGPERERVTRLTDAGTPVVVLLPN